jgi:peptide/nickel transport system permease protein
LAAYRSDTAIDRIALFLASLGVSIPNFWLGPMLILVFSIQLKLLPVSGMAGAASLILPSLTLGTAMAGILVRMLRVSLLETLRKDYVSTARAKGIKEFKVIAKHALANALIPVITVVGLQFGSLLSGSLITETIFSWPGLGRLTVSAIYARDFPLVQGCVLAIALGYVLVNFLTDLAYCVIDPRIRLS